MKLSGETRNFYKIVFPLHFCYQGCGWIRIHFCGSGSSCFFLNTDPDAALRICGVLNFAINYLMRACCDQSSLKTTIGFLQFSVLFYSFFPSWIRIQKGSGPQPSLFYLGFFLLRLGQCTVKSIFSTVSNILLTFLAGIRMQQKPLKTEKGLLFKT